LRISDAKCKIFAQYQVCANNEARMTKEAQSSNAEGSRPPMSSFDHSPLIRCSAFGLRHLKSRSSDSTRSRKMLQ
jgi:hypothetical protein